MNYKIKTLDFNKRYCVDTDGNVYRILKNGSLKKIKPITNGHGGYEKVRLYNEGYKRGTKDYKDYFVHRIVAIVFIDNPENLPIVNHKDENIKNNNVENLEWCTVQYNNTYKNARKKAGESIKKYYNDNPEQRKRVSNQFLGKKRPKEDVEKYIKHKYKPIVCFKDGLFIKEYESIKEASIDLNLQVVNICKVLKGKRKHTGGYTFEYKKQK